MKASEKYWTAREIGLVFRFYANREWSEIRKELPGRSDSAIRAKASEFCVVRASPAKRARLAKRRRGDRRPHKVKW